MEDNRNLTQAQENTYSGQQPQGNTYSGQQPQGNTYYGQGQQSQGNIYYGQQPQGNTYYGQQPQGNTYSGQQPQGNTYYGQQPQGTPYYGQQPQGNTYYGQQPQSGAYFGQQPNPYGAVPAAQPPQKKKKNAGLIIALVAAGVLAVGAVACVVFLLVGDSPQAKIAKGIQNWAKESEDYGSSIGEQLGWEQIQKMLNEESAAVNISMDLTVPDAGIPTVGLDVRSAVDRKKKLQDSEIAVSVSNVQLLEFRMSADAERIYFACPELAEKTYSLETEQLGRKFNASEWAKLTDLMLDEDMEFSLWGENDGESDTQTVEELFGEEALKRMTADVEQIAETMTAETTDTSIEVERDGKTESCKGYRVVLEKEALNRFLDDMQEEIRSGRYGQMVKERMLEELGAPAEIDEIWDEAVSILDGRFTDDLELVFYLDRKDRIVHMATPEPVKLDTSDIGFAFAVDFNGDTRTLDDVSGTIKFLGESPEESLSVDFTRTAECKKDTYDNRFEIVLSSYNAYSGEEESISAVYTNSWNLKTYDFAMDFTLYVEDEELSIGLDGAFENIRKGEGFTLNVGSASLRIDGDVLLKLRGTYEVGPLEGQIEIPETATDLLTMSQNDIMMLVYEVAVNLDDAFGLDADLLW